MSTNVNNTLADLRAIERTLDDGSAYAVRQAINTLARVATERDEALAALRALVSVSWQASPELTAARAAIAKALPAALRGEVQP